MNRKPEDKILDNSYNIGTIEFEQYDNFGIDPSYKDTRSDYEKYRDNNLYELLEDIISKSKWTDYKNKNKRISKYDLSEYFQYMRSQFKESMYSEIEIFIKTAELVNVNYKLLYDMVPNQYKKILLKELNDSYDIKNKIKTTKLF